ncbi:putative kinesin-like protein [Helianthus annuus]|uniref:Kinesin-like protein n=1 Tax=Helianthus annuus TaxID=4232 RepID=A0A9K3ISW7_HELAN|nr:putative kinesin-like protein [Helianthus annuus]
MLHYRLQFPPPEMMATVRVQCNDWLWYFQLNYLGILELSHNLKPLDKLKTVRRIGWVLDCYSGVRSRMFLRNPLEYMCFCGIVFGLIGIGCDLGIVDDSCMILLIGLATGLVGFFNNLAVENIAGFKLLLTGSLLLKERYYLAFAGLAGCNVVLATCAAVLCAYIALSIAGSGIPEVKAYLNGVDAHSILAPSTLFVKLPLNLLRERKDQWFIKCIPCPDHLKDGASYGRLIFVWLTKTGWLLDVLTGHEGPVHGLMFSPTNVSNGSGSGDWIYDGAGDQDQQLHVFMNLNVMLTNCSKNVLTQDLQLKIIIQVTCPFGFSEFDLSDIVNDSFVRELANYDLFAWNCTDDNTLTSTNLNHDRHTSIYTFDRVFDPSCLNRSVYEQGAKDVAISTIKGINSTIFAYSQTSSGKTYTLKGIADNCINDISAHITNATASRFVLKFSAIEIYNETVVDLLNRDSGALRLLDDPEKGTVVEKLTEEVV